MVRALGQRGIRSEGCYQFSTVQARKSSTLDSHFPDFADASHRKRPTDDLSHACFVIGAICLRRSTEQPFSQDWAIRT